LRDYAHARQIQVAITGTGIRQELIENIRLHKSNDCDDEGRPIGIGHHAEDLLTRNEEKVRANQSRLDEKGRSSLSESQKDQ
jgi:hypothetical protein